MYLNPKREGGRGGSEGQRGLPLITYASRGGGGVNTNAYKCVQGGRGGLNMTKNTHFVRRFIENATISDTFKDRHRWLRAISESPGLR